MIARYHYDDEVFRRLLDDSLPAEENEAVQSHVESCELCQERLEKAAPCDITWDEVRRFLMSPVNKHEKMDEDTVADSVHVQTLSFLKPSEISDAMGTFGRYQVTEVLGRGGMGLVMRGYDPALNRYSAIKVLAPELATHSAARKRFSREAKSAAAVVHEHVIPIQTVDEQDGFPYLVMPVIEGQSLQQRVSENGPLEIKEVLRIGSQIASGLSAAHAQGLVHRDVKPGNILLENGVERVMITDFGLARAADDASMTQSGVISGTPQYMSPEQARGGEVSCSSDLFSLGSVLYCMCTGHSPFRAETTYGILHRIINDEPRSARSVNVDVPQWLDEIILKLLAKDPEHRFGSAKELEQELASWLAHLQSPDQSPPPRPISVQDSGGRDTWKKWLSILGPAFLFLVASVAIYLNTGDGMLVIKAEDPGIPIRILQESEVIDRLTVRQSDTSTEIAAGKYRVVIDGEGHEYEVVGGEVRVLRNRKSVVVVRRKPFETKRTAPAGNLARERESSQSLRDGKTVFNGSPPVTRKFAEIDRRTSQLIFRIPDQCRLDSTDLGVTVENGGRCDLIHPYCSQWVLQSKSDDSVDPLSFELEVYSGNKELSAYLMHNAIPIVITEEDVKHVRTDRFLTKVVYYPTPEKSAPLIKGLQTISSNRVDAGLDPVEEAARHGTIIAIVRFVPEKNAGEHNQSLSAKVGQFNGWMNLNHPNHGQPLLTVSEIVTMARWNLSDKTLKESQKALFETIVEWGELPLGWQIVGGKTVISDKRFPDGVQLDAWSIRLIKIQRPEIVHQVRLRYLGHNLKASENGDANAHPDERPLAAAIHSFNSSNHSINGVRQPAITEDEVIAAIIGWRAKRNESGLSNRDFEHFLRIAETRSLPKDCEFEVIGNFHLATDERFLIWSVRIRVPNTDKEGWTSAFTIRKQFIAVDAPRPGDISWGLVGRNGLQAGVRIVPNQESYSIGDKIEVEIFYRAIHGPVKGALPNAFTCKRVIATDSKGTVLPVRSSPNRIIGGWMSMNFGIQSESRKARPIVFVAADELAAVEENEDADEFADGYFRSGLTNKVGVKSGETYELSFVVPNHADGESKDDLTTGKTTFSVGESALVK